MDSGWYGGMTQGLGMSFLVRMYNATGNESYMDAALNSTKTLSINVSDGGVLRHYQNYSWYEEYPTPDAGSFVLNGYVYTLVGLYDLIEEFNDSLSIGLYQNGILTFSNDRIIRPWLCFIIRFSSSFCPWNSTEYSKRRIS